MSHKIAGDDARRLYRGQLVRPQKLGVDHHIALGAGHSVGGKELGRRRIPVAVAQQLHTLGLGRAHKLPHLGVGVNGVAHIARLPAKIRRRDPGGAALGAAVQKNFIAADFKPAAVPLPELRQPARQAGILLHVAVAHYVERQLSGAGRLRQQLRLGLLHKAVLRRGDAVAQVGLLAPAQQLPRLFLAGGHGFRHHFGKGQLLQISVWFPRLVPADPPALRVGRLAGNAHLPQHKAAHAAHVAAGMPQNHRVPRQRCVQKLPGGVGAAGQVVVVVTGADHRRAGRDVVFAHKFPQPPGDLVQTVGAGQACVLQVVCELHKMAVGVDKAGQQGPPLQVHRLCPGGRAPQRFQRPHRRNALPPHQHGLRAHARLVHGEHRAAVKQFFPFLVHKKSHPCGG